jgi:hypothetical protein
MKQKTTANGEKKVFIRTTHAQSLPGQSSLGDTESCPSMPNAKTGTDSLIKTVSICRYYKTDWNGHTRTTHGINMIPSNDDLQSSAWYKKSKNITSDTTANAPLSNAFHCSLIFALENSLL